MLKKITIQILGWNSAKELADTLRVLSEVPDSLADIVYIDNASTDNSIELVERLCPLAKIIRLQDNRGFSAGNNVGLRECDTPYVLLLNPDARLVWGGIEQLITEFENDPKLGAAQGLLMREGDIAVGSIGNSLSCVARTAPARPKVQAGGRADINESRAARYVAKLPTATSRQLSKRGVIDSAGIVLTFALNGRDRGAGEEDAGQFDEEAPLTAVTGACGMYRMSALNDVAHEREGKKEYLDEDFFAYKEDVDLGWRLNNAGWKVKYFPVNVGVHARGLRQHGFMNWGLNPVRVYSRLTRKRTRYSVRNWVWLVVKNISAKQVVVHGGFISLRFLLLLFLSLLYFPLVTVWLEVLSGLPRMVGKRVL
jgi:GT2 family glycosyltransferase